MDTLYIQDPTKNFKIFIVFELHQLWQNDQNTPCQDRVKDERKVQCLLSTYQKCCYCTYLVWLRYQFKVQMCLDFKPIELDTKINKNFASKECLYEAFLQSFSCYSLSQLVTPDTTKWLKFKQSFTIIGSLASTSFTKRVATATSPELTQSLWLFCHNLFKAMYYRVL